MVFQEENISSEKPFLEEEIKEAIMGSYANGVPGPDGLSFLFYQTFWDLIKKDFMALVRDFEEGSLDIQRLNYAISKEPDAKDMKKFRPICLSNCSIKIFSKAMANRECLLRDKDYFLRVSLRLSEGDSFHKVWSQPEAIHELHNSSPRPSSNYIMGNLTMGLTRISWWRC